MSEKPSDFPDIELPPEDGQEPTIEVNDVQMPWNAVSCVGVAMWFGCVMAAISIGSVTPLIVAAGTTVAVGCAIFL